MAKDLKLESRVALSALFLRSIGGTHPLAETHGTVTEVRDSPLFKVRWDAGFESHVNKANLVLVEDKWREANRVEHNNLAPGVTIGHRRK